jgi:hypothetical protein
MIREKLLINYKTEQIMLNCSDDLNISAWISIPFVPREIRTEGFSNVDIKSDVV